jgi:MoxR-like ATPase
MQALILAAKVTALLDGREAVAVDDVRAVAIPALRHRLILNYEAQAEGADTDAIVAEVVAATPAK